MGTPSEDRAVGSSGAPCELLLELFSGRRGSVHLGRLLRGEDAGRFVLLREVPGAAVTRLAPDVDIARSIAHPQLLKLLGFVRTEGQAYLASEYVPGVALTELLDAVRKRNAPVRASVVTRIVRDALAAAATARQLLRDAAGLEAVSAFHPDSIWIAEFGETMLIPVGASELLGGNGNGSATDSAASLIIELSTALTPVQVLSEGLEAHLPGALAEALSSALSRSVASGPDPEATLLEALEGLQGPLVATEDQVKQELQRLLASTLQLRRSLQGLEGTGMTADGNDATVISRLPRADIGFDQDEPTLAFRADMLPRTDSLPRESDPDGVTQVAPRAEPSIIIAPDSSPGGSIPPSTQWAKQFLETTQLTARKASVAPSRAPDPSRSWLYALLGLVLLGLAAVIWLLAFGRR